MNKYERFENGVLVESIPYSDEEVAELNMKRAKQKIQELEEAAMTPRRLREAILNKDNGWLANQESLIEAERAKL